VRRAEGDEHPGAAAGAATRSSKAILAKDGRVRLRHDKRRLICLSEGRGCSAEGPIIPFMDIVKTQR